MKIEIKLINPTVCDDCPCLQIDRMENYYCGFKDNEYYFKENTISIVRPKKCIDENGE